MNEQQQAHIDLLCTRHNIHQLTFLQAGLLSIKIRNLRFLAAPNSFSTQGGDSGGKFVFINPDDAESDQEEYFAGLHEIGHLMHKHRNGENGITFNQVIQNEIEAWEWAVAHANEFPADDTVCFIIDNLSTYTDHPPYLACVQCAKSFGAFHKGDRVGVVGHLTIENIYGQRQTFRSLEDMFDALGFVQT